MGLGVVGSETRGRARLTMWRVRGIQALVFEFDGRGDGCHCMSDERGRRGGGWYLYIAPGIGAAISFFDDGGLRGRVGNLETGS